MTVFPKPDVAATALLRSYGIDGPTASELRERIRAGSPDAFDPELLAAVDNVVATRAALHREATVLIERLKQTRRRLVLGRGLNEEDSIGTAALRFEAKLAALEPWTGSSEAIAQMWKGIG